MHLTSQNSTNWTWLLAGGLVCAAGWLFYTESIVPLQKREIAEQSRITELSEKLAEAGQGMRRVRELEASFTAAQEKIDRWDANRPADSTMLWFPERVKQHFSRCGVVAPVTRLNSAHQEDTLPGFERSYWAVELPLRDYSTALNNLLVAVSQFEKSEPHTRVLDFAILQDAENPGARTAMLNVSTLAR